MRINLKDIEERIRPLGGKLKYDKEFIFELLNAYGRSSGNITRLRNGQLNVADNKDIDVAQKNIVYFKPAIVSDDELYTIVDDLKSSPAVIRYSTRFVIATNYRKLRAIDTKTNETLDVDIDQIDKHYAFFLPWAGMEKAQFVGENHADVKAADKMAKLFDEIIASNDTGDAKYYHNLNVFFTRILFCFFAEDTGIFKKDQFTNAIGSYTQKDGSDVSAFLQELFTALDIEDKTGYASHIVAFPYVNGKLFHTTFPVPEFNHKARDLILQCGGELDWSDINPDIFGSMIQAVVNPGQRASLGMHYTSVPNIMKTIEPLFLDEFKDEINKYWDNSNQLEKILSRLSNVKIFDPACGSGNFLIIAYKELRKLEHTILERQGDLGTTNASLLGSRINIEHFYGIEIDDFAHEVAILSLWLAKHQMNIEFAKKFGIDLPLIPLKEAGNIIRGNAARLVWSEVCPRDTNSEIYLISNPPYLGARRQQRQDKDDMDYVFKSATQRYKNLDYVAIWFFKAAEFLFNSPRSAAAIVSNNSISQGQQVELLWPLVLLNGVEIDYAYTSFKWENNAKNAAKVTCVIIAFSKRGIKKKFIEDISARLSVENITPYLTEKLHNNIIGSRSKPISDIPKMEFGNMPLDGGALLLEDSDKSKLLEDNPEAEIYIKRLYGAKEYINDIPRWCLWIEDYQVDNALKIEAIRERVNLVKNFRLDSKDAGTRKKADKPYQFREHKCSKVTSLIIPSTSSERRDYIPIGFLPTDNVVSNSAQVIYDPETYVFGLISSRMHMVWVRAVAGRLKTDYRYSSAIVYNNFPVPPLTSSEQRVIEEKVFGVIDVRESHSEKTLAQMYDPDKMPDNLRLAHQELDDVIDGIYRIKPFENDEVRLAHLFDLYEKMTSNEKEKK